MPGLQSFRMRQQPQQGAPVDTGHPIARGLVSYLLLAGKACRDSVDNVAWSITASATPIAFDAATRGVGMRVKGATPSYVSRPVPAAISASSTQPISFRFRLVFFSIGSTNTALVSWGSTPQDGTPRFYMRLNGAGQLEFFFSGGYHSDFIVSVVAGREYIFEWNFDGTTHRGKLNGVPLPGTSISGWGGNAASFYLGMGFDGANASTDFLISDFAMWNRGRLAQESASDTQNPWQMFALAGARNWFAKLAAQFNSAIVSAVGSVSSTSGVSGVGCRIVKASGGCNATANVSAVGARVFPTSGTSNGISTVAATGRRLAVTAGASFGNSTPVEIGRSIRIATGISNGASSVTGSTLSALIARAIGTAAGQATALAVGRSIRSSVGVSPGVSAVTGYGIRLVTAIGTSSSASNAYGYGRMIRNGIGYAAGRASVRAYVHETASPGKLTFKLTLKVALPKVIRKAPVVIRAIKG